MEISSPSKSDRVITLWAVFFTAPQRTRPTIGMIMWQQIQNTSARARSVKARVVSNANRSCEGTRRTDSHAQNPFGLALFPPFRAETSESASCSVEYSFTKNSMTAELFKTLTASHLPRGTKRGVCDCLPSLALPTRTSLHIPLQHGCRGKDALMRDVVLQMLMSAVPS